MWARNRRGQAGIISAIVVIMVTLMAVSLALSYMNNTVQISNKKAEAASDILTLQSIIKNGNVKSFYYYNASNGVLYGWVFYNVPEPVKLDYVEAIVKIGSDIGNSQSYGPIAVVNQTNLLLAGKGLLRVLYVNLTKYTGTFIPTSVKVSTFKVGVSFRKAAVSMVMNSTKTTTVPPEAPVNTVNPVSGGRPAGGSAGTGSSTGSIGGGNSSGGAGFRTYNIFYHSKDRNIKLTGSISFTVTGGTAVINHHTISKGDLVTLVFDASSVNDDGEGYLSISKNGLVKFEFHKTNVKVFLNGREIGDALIQDLSIDGIYVNISKVKSTLTFEVKPRPAGKTILISNGTLVISHKKKDATHIIIKYIEPGSDGLYINIYGDHQFISNYEGDGPAVAKYVSLKFEENSCCNSCDHDDDRHFELRLEPITEDHHEPPIGMKLHSEIWGVNSAKMIITGTSGGIPIKIVLDLSKQCPSEDGSFDAVVSASDINSSMSILVPNETSGNVELNAYCNHVTIGHHISTSITTQCYHYDGNYKTILLTNVAPNPLYGFKMKLFDDKFYLTSYKGNLGAMIDNIYVNGHLCTNCDSCHHPLFGESGFLTTVMKTENRIWYVKGSVSFMLNDDGYLMSIVLHKGFIVKYVFDFEAPPES